jgi:hypothetical protein
MNLLANEIYNILVLVFLFGYRIMVDCEEILSFASECLAVWLRPYAWYGG